MVTKRYKVYALFRKDYKDLKTNARMLLIKCIFYGVFTVVTLVK